MGVDKEMQKGTKFWSPFLKGTGNTPVPKEKPVTSLTTRVEQKSCIGEGDQAAQHGEKESKDSSCLLQGPMPKPVQEKMGAGQSLRTTASFKVKPFKAPAKAKPAQGKENKGIASSRTGATKPKDQGIVAAEAIYYSCLYSARSSKKKKPSLQDGVLQVADTKCSLYSHEGKIVGKTTAKECMNMPDGATLEIGMWELEIFGQLPASAFLDGSCFLGSTVETGSGDQADKGAAAVSKRTTAKPFRTGLQRKPDVDKFSQVPSMVCRYAFNEASILLHDEVVEETTYAVVVDPFLATKLRRHQEEGVRFMYRCVLGLQMPSSSGCLLADEMGLGKTLQTLTLIWTLLKQGPLGKPAAIRRAVVVCPSSLVENWANEVKKWLGNERLRALAIHAGTSAADAKLKFDDFINGSVWPLLITSYELARKYASKIAEAKCGLLVCDEAHRLKNSAGNKTIEALLSLSCARRVLLSGTPLQNNLSEFFAMMSFIAPDLLGSLSTFKRLYADPIERSRDRTATDEEKLLGEARSAELQKRTQLFVLRRTSEVNAKYLPPRTEYVVFCNLQPLQVEIYQALLQSKAVSSLLRADLPTATHSVLATIGLLRKLCNHPYLLHPDRTGGSIDNQDPRMDGSASSNIPPEAVSLLTSQPHDPAAIWELSGKFASLMAILQTVAEQNASSGNKDKVVVVSEWTATLDVVQEECTRRSWGCLRLDGATAVSDRQGMVNRFNLGHGNETIFLLSKKAGGCGLNLIGAHRLILFETDWNPANDKQAMARIWRDGQTKPVVIYRLLSRGTIEEKVYQRQIAKDEVAAEVSGGSGLNKSSNNQRNFSKEELKQLFTLRTDTPCDTRDLVRSSASEDSSWEDASSRVSDEPLRAAIEAGYISFVRQQFDQSKVAVLDHEDDSTAAEPVQQALVEKVPDKVGVLPKSKLQKSPAQFQKSSEGRPKKRRKKVVCSDSESNGCEDERIFEELDEEDEEL